MFVERLDEKRNDFDPDFASRWFNVKGENVLLYKVLPGPLTSTIYSRQNLKLGKLLEGLDFTRNKGKLAIIVIIYD